MKEQSEYLSSLGFTATYIGKDSSEDQDILEENYEFLFTSPESILSVSKWRDMVTSSKKFRLFELLWTRLTPFYTGMFENSWAYYYYYRWLKQ